MPLFDYLCSDCGKRCELLVTTTGEKPQCTACGSTKLEKLLSVPSSIALLYPLYTAPGFSITSYRMSLINLT